MYHLITESKEHALFYINYMILWEGRIGVMSDNTFDIQLNNADSFMPTALNMLAYYDIVSLDSVQNKLMKIQQILKNHSYAITPPKDDNGRWQTYYKDTDGNRKIIRAVTKEELIKKLVEAYTGIARAKKLTMTKLYDEWLEYKKTITNSPNTIRRHIQHYNKYFADTPMFKRQVSGIDELSMEIFCNNIIKQYNLSKKEWGNVKGILNGMFLYARRKGYITDNPMDNIIINIKFRQVSKKSGKTQVYDEEELKQLLAYIDEYYEKTENIALLAVKLNFFIGLRVGELVALKWEDIDIISKQIHVEREEVRDQITNKYSIVNHTKTNTDRYVPIPDKALEVLKKISDKSGGSEYIFVRSGKRINARAVAYVLEKYAERTGHVVKSTHKMRKTYASSLYNNGVSADKIREMLGHTSLVTALTSYIYDTAPESKTIENINKAFNDL